MIFRGTGGGGVPCRIPTTKHLATNADPSSVADHAYPHPRPPPPAASTIAFPTLPANPTLRLESGHTRETPCTVQVSTVRSVGFSQGQEGVTVPGNTVADPVPLGK